MAKKKTDKETEPKKISKNRFTTFFKSETTHFVIGLISVIFSVYLLLAFISFFFTGAADQSILDNQQPGELMQTTNHVKNYAGARGAQLAEFLINECFGIAGNGLCPVLSYSFGSPLHWDLFSTERSATVLSTPEGCTGIM